MQHVYLTVHGEYKDGPYLGEAAQIGFRFAFAPVLTAPVMGETFDMAEHGDAVPAFGTLAGTSGTLTKAWTARVGPDGSGENWSDAEQVAAGEAAYALATALKAYENNNYHWTHVKQAPIDALGKTIGTGSTFTFTTKPTGAGTAALPAQSAVAVSTRANIVGRTGRGRFYVPALSDAILSNDGTISGTPAVNLKAAAKAYIDAMQGIGGTLSLWQPLNVITSAGKASAVRPVEVRIGDLVDTIRSRRAQVEETYTVLPL